MNSRTTIRLLTALCTVEMIVIGALLWSSPAPLADPVRPEPLAAGPDQKQPAGTTPIGPPGGSVVLPPELAQQNLALTTELAAMKKELEAYKSQISVPYGPPRQAGRFVGRTFRKMFEAAAAQDPGEVQERTAENQIRVYSLGPFIQMAESIEGDPTLFAQFQGSLIGEVLELPTQRDAEVEAMLAELSARSLKTETGSPEWSALNDTALQKITAMLPDDQKQAMQGRLEFFQRYGVLMIPAYSILRAPTPTIAMPPAPDPGVTK